MNAIFLCDGNSIDRVYPDSVIETIRSHSDFDSTHYTKASVLESPDQFSSVEYIFSTWGMPMMTESEIRRCFPNLKYVFYAAGSVQTFARPFLNCGVKVVSCWAANGIPVAEYAVSQILLANKGFFSSSRLFKDIGHSAAHQNAECYLGNYDTSVGIIGAGMIGKMIIRRLHDYHLSVKVFDPFLPDDAAEELNVTKCSLEEIFSECTVISNHLANNEATKGMLNGELFSLMRPYSTFINTGRGAQVVENDLAAMLKSRPDVTAILDVTEPEPPLPENEFYRLPNCILTPHIAGSIGLEVHRMAEYAAEEFLRHLRSEPCKYEVSLEMLKTMA